MNNKHRFIVHDEWGPVRSFHSKKEAQDWMRERTNTLLVIIPKEPKENIFETTEESPF